jgi:phage protein D/phage baseplate assembly protein gpV
MPETSKDTVPLYRILIDGQELDPVEANFVHEIKITDWLRMPDVCSLAVGYPAKPEGEPFQALDASAFEIGAKLEVKLGGTDESTTETLFKGEIVTVEPDFHAGGASMVVRAYDKSHRMMRTRKQRTFANQTSSDIVTKICSEYSLSPSTKSSGGPHDMIIQHNETDWDFIWRLARRVGFEFVVEDAQASFGPPNVSGEAVELNYPEQLRAFRPRITAVQQVESVNVRGFDLKSKQQVVRNKSRPEQVTEAGITRSKVAGKFAGATLEISGQSFSSTAEADQLAQAALDQLANAYLAAEGTCAGNPKVKAGAKLKISGIGSNYSGTYRVAKATHVLRGGSGYVTQFSNSAGEHSLIGQTGNGGGPFKVDSLMVGVVTNNNDPDKQGRLKIQLPALSGEETFWAPLAGVSAGNERGLLMLPVAGEQVLVGFENGDPSYPYVLGSLFNGRDKPGEELAVADGSFALKSDHKALFAAKEDITLHSEKGKWEIKIDGGEIKETVKSGGGGAGGYTGDFGGSWGLKATGGITIESQASVTIKAPSISVEAQGQLSLKGAQVQIDGQAMVTISGPLINIG